MKKNRNLLKLFFTCIQILVLSLPILSLGGYALADKLHFINLAKSVSGATSVDINDNQDIFDEETTDINKYALASIHDYGYIQSEGSVIDYNYTPLYFTNEPVYNGGVLDTSSLIMGNVYVIDFYYEFGVSYPSNTTLFDGSFDILDFYTTKTNSFSSYTTTYNIARYEGCNSIILNKDGYTLFITNLLRGNAYLLTATSTYSTNHYRFVVKLNSLNTFTDVSYFKIYGATYNEIPFTINPVEITFNDIPSFISATEGLSYEEIVSNNYVNTHLLLNLDIVGLFTTGLNGSDYIFLFLNYYLNYVLTFALVFICFDVIMYFILIVRKILDRSVEFTDRREF